MSIIRASGLCLMLLAAVAPADTMIRWKPVKAGTASAATVPSQAVFRTRVAFDAYWAQNFGEAKQPKGIDWAHSELIAIHLGPRGSLGYTVGVSSVVESSGETVVKWFERTPAANAKPPMRTTSPYVIVSIPASSEPVQFRGHVEEPGNPFSTGNAFPVRKLLSGDHSMVKQENTQVIDDASTLAELWQNAFGSATPAPKADFGTWRYMAIFLGQRPTPGYNIVVQRIARIGPKEVQVIYTETKPAKDAIEPQMITSPFVILELPKTDDEVTVQRSN